MVELSGKGGDYDADGLTAEIIAAYYIRFEMMGLS
jgi:hypothetical protein